MTKSPEIKVENDCNNELQKIDGEISIAQKRLDELKTKEPKDELTKNQITELETKLKELENKREKIISQTQSCLKGEKVDNKDFTKNLDNTNLSQQKKQEVKSALDKQTGNSFDLSKIEGGILGIILAILQAFSGGIGSGISSGEREYVEIGNDGKEIPGKTIKGKEKTPKDKENFISQYKDIAKQMQEEFKIPWEFIITQAGLESGWGTSGLATTYNNLFGIKGKKGGKSVMLWTWEVENGQKVRKKEPFRVYYSVEESFRDHARLLCKNPRYKNAFNYSNNPVNFAVEIAKAGYATDTKYAGKLTSTMKGVA